MWRSPDQPAFAPANSRCRRCGARDAGRVARRVLVFDGFRCNACGYLNSYPMATAHVVGCLVLPVLAALFCTWWLALALGILSAALLLLDLRLRLDQGNAVRRFSEADASEARVQPSNPPGVEPEIREHQRSNASTLDSRGVENAQLLLDWTVTSSLFGGFVASLFLSAIVVPLGDRRLVVTIGNSHSSTLPKFTPETSTLVALGIFAYFLVLSWLVVRRLTFLLRMSPRTRRLYTLMLFLPGINLIALGALSQRAKEALRSVADGRPTQC